jgi:hypothetical protein
MANPQNNHLKKMIGDGQIQQAIDELLVVKKNQSHIKEALAIASRYNRLKQKDRLGILSFEQLNITENQIVAHLIDLVDHPEDEPYPVENSIAKTPTSKPILWKYIAAAAVVIGILGSLAEVLNLIRIFPSNEKLQLTVFVTDLEGNAVLENEGRLNIPLGNRSLNEVIGANGRTNFPDITSDNKGDTIRIGLEAEGWEIAEGKKTFVFTGKPVHLKVKRDNSLGTIKGVVKSRDGQNFIEGAKVLINADTAVFSDANGIFKVLLPEKMQVKKVTDGYKLTITKEGYETKTEYHYPKSSDAEIRLEKSH